MLRLAEAEKNNQKSLGHAMEALLLASRLRSDELQARVYARMRYNYRSQRTPELYYVDSLAVVSARRSGNDLLLFNAIDAYVRDLLNENKLRQAAALLQQSDSLAGLNDTLRRRSSVALLRSVEEYKNFHMRSALVFAQTSLKYARMADAGSYIAEALAWIAGCYSNLSRYDSAADHYFKSLDIWKKTGNGSQIGRIYSGLGALYKTSGDLASAIGYHRRAFAVFNEEKDEIQAAYEQLAIAEVFLRQKKKDSALTSMHIANATFRRLNNAQGLLLSFSTFAKYYMFSGNKDSAGHYIKLTQQYLQKSESPSLDYYASAFKVINDIHQGNLTEGQTGLRKLLVRTKELLPEEMIVNAITKLNLPDMTDSSKVLLKNIIINKDTGSIQMGTDFLNEFTGTMPVLDSLIVLKYQEQIADLETIHRVKEAQAETKLVRQQVAQRNIIIFFSILVVALLCMLLHQVNQRKKNAQQTAVREEMYSRKIESLKDDLAHRGNNILNRIMQIVEEVKEKTTDPEAFELLQQKMEPMIVLNEMLNELPQEELDMQIYLSRICNGLKSAFTGEKDISVIVDAPVRLPGDKAGPVGLIVNELVTNSFKHAFKIQAHGEIAVTCNKKQDNKYLLTITDNGTGIPDKDHDSDRQGLQLVTRLAYEIDAEINRQQGKGTGFEIYFM